MSKDKLKFCALKQGAIIPSKRDEDAGWDIYACFDEDYIEIKPHETVMLPTGIASAFDSKYVAVLHERGSTGTKGIGQRSGVIDSGFRAEWMVPVTNHNDKKTLVIVKDGIAPKARWKKDYIIYRANKAICQMLLLPVPQVEVETVTEEELMSIESERGTGKLGSSGK